MGCKKSKEGSLTFTEENDRFMEKLVGYSKSGIIVFNITQETDFRVLIGYVNSDECVMRCYHKHIQLEPVERCEEDCPICLEPLKTNVVKLSLCTHRFHKKCIKQHFKLNGESCPMCRAKPYVPEHICELVDKMNSYDDDSSDDDYDDY